MQIGSFKNVNGDYFGSIATAAINLPRLGLKPVEGNSTKKHPAFQVMALNPARRWVEIGALWKETSNSKGTVFYQGRVDDPSFAQSLSIALFPMDEEDGFNVVWNRRRPRRDDGFGDAGEASDETPPLDQEGEAEESPRRQRRSRQSSSFEGNATEDGKLADGANAF